MFYLKKTITSSVMAILFFTIGTANSIERAANINAKAPLTSYMGGGVSLPSYYSIPEGASLDSLNNPSLNYLQIQGAIDKLIATTMPDPLTGIRGAIKLNAGIFEISQPLIISGSGVILRGSGQESDGTIIRNMSAWVHHNSVIVVDGGLSLRIQQVGIEDLSVETVDSAIADHKRTFYDITMANVENSWIRDVTTKLNSDGFTALNGGNKITIQNMVKAGIVDLPPTVNAGADFNVFGASLSAFTNATSADDIGIVSYQWTCDSALCAGVCFDTPNTANTFVNFPNLGSNPNAFTLTLTVSDGVNSPVSDSVIVTVIDTPNQAPVVNAGVNHNITLPTNSVAVSGSCSDPDNGPGALSCIWSGSAGVSFANVNSLNTTATFSGAGSYTVTMTGNDTDLSSSDSASITVIAEASSGGNTAPTANAGNNQTIKLSETTTLSGQCSDDGKPNGATVSATWSGSGAAFGNKSSLTSTVSFSSTGSHSVTLTCNDSDKTGLDSVVITVIANNDEKSSSEEPKKSGGGSFTWLLIGLFFITRRRKLD